MSSSPERPCEADSSFRPAFLFLKPKQRRALSAFYGYARTVDDIADDGSVPFQKKQAALSAWRNRLEELFSGAGPRGRLEEELVWAADAFSMRKENFLLVLEGMEMDTRKTEYASFDELKLYMYRVASAVGMSALEIFGWSGANARAYAENLGYAVQLTNIIRDVFEDAGAGRTYIPLDDLKRFDCNPASFQNSVYPNNFIELMKFEAARAREFYARARELAEGPDKDRLFSAFIMGQLYSDLLDKIESRGFRTAGPRIRMNLFEKLRAVYRAWRNC
ncbi:MAG: squalene/phytoene synthase family protein [Elusimicrobiota bacterium]